jgi:hypothetical protein
LFSASCGGLLLIELRFPENPDAGFSFYGDLFINALVLRAFFFIFPKKTHFIKKEDKKFETGDLNC